MTADTLRSAADTFLAAGREIDAAFTRSMADACDGLNRDKPGLGDALYRTWAKDQAERAANIRRMG